MKNIGEAVSIVRHLERPSREIEEKAEAEAEYEIHRKMTMFFLEEDPSIKIYSHIEWCKNLKDEIVLIAPDISFQHVRTNIPYRNVLACILGCTGWDDEKRGKWETLCLRIDNLVNIQEIIFGNTTYEVCEPKK